MLTLIKEKSPYINLALLGVLGLGWGASQAGIAALPAITNFCAAALPIYGIGLGLGVVGVLGFKVGEKFTDRFFTTDKAGWVGLAVGVSSAIGLIYASYTFGLFTSPTIGIVAAVLEGVLTVATINEIAD